MINTSVPGSSCLARYVRRAFLLIAAALSSVPCHSRAASISLGQAADFVILGLENGTVTINSATSIIGNVGYSAGVVSTTNQKVDTFTGTVFVHSTATFSYTAATFVPSGGFMYGPGAVDTKLNQANIDALSASSMAAALAPTHVLPPLGDNDNVVINSLGAVNVVSLPSLDYKEDVMELVSRPGFTDTFIINVAGNFEMDASEIKLTGLSPGNVLFNFPNASTIDINKAENIFRGTILAPVGDVEYHNPATFTGAIIAKYIDVHSDFNISNDPFIPPPIGNIPEPATWVLVAMGILGALTRRQLRAF